MLGQPALYVQKFNINTPLPSELQLDLKKLPPRYSKEGLSKQNDSNIKDILNSLNKQI